MKDTFKARPFIAGSDPELKAQHELILRWVKDALDSLPQHSSYKEVELKSFPSGQAILDAKPDEARRLVLAAVKQSAHWDREVERVRAQAKDEGERVNAHFLPGWDVVWGSRRQTVTVIHALFRRSLPFVAEDIELVLAWCNAMNPLSTYYAPLSYITKAVERFAKDNELTPSLRQQLQKFGARLRGSHEKDAKRLGTVIEQLCADGVVQPEPAIETAANARPVKAEPAGNPAVLSMLKQQLCLTPSGAPAESIEIGPDHFHMRADSPLQTEHALLTELFNEVIGTTQYHSPDLKVLIAGKAILALNAQEKGRLFLATAERVIAGVGARTDYHDHGSWQSIYSAAGIVPAMAEMEIDLDRSGVFDLLLFISSRNAYHQTALKPAREILIQWVDSHCNAQTLTEGERYVLFLLRNGIILGPMLGTPSDEIVRLNTLIGDGATFFLAPGEVWSDAVNADYSGKWGAQRKNWIALFKHFLKATSARPSDKWLKSAEDLIAALTPLEISNALRRWLPLVAKGRSIQRVKAYQHDSRSSADTINEENAICLRGLLWIIPQLKQNPSEMARLVAGIAVSAYKKVPGIGPRCVKVGNAAVYALSELNAPEAVGHLAMLKVRVKFGTAQKEIEKAFNAAAEALNIPRDQIEEMGVPIYGLEEVGLRREEFGEEYRAEVRVEGRDVKLLWFKADGTEQKSVPAKVKSDFGEDYKELQIAVKDIAAMLPAQAERIDGMFLLQQKWPVAQWRERYLDHPLVGTIARRLIWVFRLGKTVCSGTWLKDRLVNVDDEPVDISPEAEVELWHPLGRPLDEVLSWRGWLEKHEIRQPFKQAHREVYILTDAERRTRTYSNRFAAHILRQHQFHALCAARGWKNKLRLMVDDSYPPATRELQKWGMRAEYWIEGIGDGYGTDTNESGAYLRVSTDQVRFYRTGASENYAHAGGGSYTNEATGPGEQNVNEPLTLDQIPPLVFSEIMRDVDLFVGIASLANDPTWQDGGPGGRFRTYWQSYSFGELNESAQTRRAVLQNLLPRLTKLRDRWTLEDRFLVIRGELRTYKIHLGSGNILMLPNDQYLCVVADRSSKSTENVFLPFEGDNMLSIILSKAFLLVDDKKIKDPTITRQISSESK